MVRNKRLIFIVGVTLIQKFILNYSGMEFNYLFFAGGFPISNVISLHNLYTIIWFFPIYFILFYFSDSVEDIVLGYGKLIMLRCNNRNFIYIKTIFKNYLVLLFFVIVQVTINFNDLFKSPLISKSETFELLGVYYLTLITLVTIQMFIELVVNSKVSNLILNMYIIISVIIWNQTTLINGITLPNYLLIPNFAIGYRNGIISHNLNIIDSKYPILVLIILNLFIILISTITMNKKDIY